MEPVVEAVGLAVGGGSGVAAAVQRLRRVELAVVEVVLVAFGVAVAASKRRWSDGCEVRGEAVEGTEEAGLRFFGREGLGDVRLVDADLGATVAEIDEV